MVQKCVVLYAHGGGYARGEAKMYINYMERWVKAATLENLDMVFLSVEYRRSTPR
jgi:acetyl esterase/lipase